MDYRTISIMKALKYPIGTQSFEVLRNDGCVYVDKTEYIYRMVNSGSRTFFMSRPRRFGKSLLLSTIEAYFRGKKHLFEGLAIYDLEKDWESYPILHFDFSAAEATVENGLKSNIDIRLNQYAKEFDAELVEGASISENFGVLIQNVAHKTGKQVVILVDEYDKGIVDVLDNASLLESNQSLLRPFFSQIKAQNAHIRFCFITGVARFRHYTLFSGFNNPEDISMAPAYSAICGITIDELLSNFRSGIQCLAEAIDVGFDEALTLLKQKYDGYRFTRNEVYVFNPFSILNCLSQCDVSNYWMQSGTSRVFVKYLLKSDFDISELTDLWLTKENLESVFDPEYPIPLLFQTGYLTVKDYNRGLFKLDIPNGEVRSALVNELLPRQMGIKESAFNRTLANICDMVERGDVDDLMRALTSMIASVPYHEFDFKDIEKSYHLILYTIFLMLGVDVRSEIAMSGGRIDMVVSTNHYVYVMEFKLDGTADEALGQIDDRGYAIPWHADGRKVLKIGVSFPSKTRTISQWRATEG